MPKKNHNFLGELARPIRIPPPPQEPVLLAEDSAQAKYKQEVDQYNANLGILYASQAIAKLSLLLKHYKIDKNDEDRWFQLSIYLAKEYVPGFRTEFEKRGGRPVTWGPITQMRLYYDVVNFRRKAQDQGSRIPNISDACRALAKREPWKGKASMKVLINQYGIARNSPLVRMLENIADQSQLAPLVAEFISTDFGPYAR